MTKVNTWLGSREHSGNRLAALSDAELGAILKMRLEHVIYQTTNTTLEWETAIRCVEAINASIARNSVRNEDELEFRGFQKFELMLMDTGKALP